MNPLSAQLLAATRKRQRMDDATAEDDTTERVSPAGLNTQANTVQASIDNIDDGLRVDMGLIEGETDIEDDFWVGNFQLSHLMLF